MKDKLKKYPLFLLLLPLFFVLHGFTENYDFVPVIDAALLFFIYLISTLILLVLSWMLFRNWSKAALLTFFLMAFHFFFGSIQDGLRKTFPGFLSKYIFILPASLCLLILLIILLRRRKKSLTQFAFYLNFLFLLLIAIDGVWLINKMIAGQKNKNAPLSNEFTVCTNCNNPDVYIIISDEYAGNTELKEMFNFDNTLFVNELANRGFHTIANSTSNYNYTPYSIASTLNMDYLDLDRTGKQPLLAYTYETIKDNQFLKFLQHHQYRFYNYSFFNFAGQPAHTQETFLPVSTRLITGQTFLSRVNKELRFNLVTRLNSDRELKKLVYANKQNNKTLFDLTFKTAADKIKQPKFVLTHLMTPHYPYYFDKEGKEFPFETLVEEQKFNRQHYIEYLQYGNNKLLELIDHILKNSSSPPVIVLMGDHGFRNFNEKVDPKYYFLNFVSIHLPSYNYSSFKDSLTNVNLLRTVLNTTFQQKLSYFKDTTFVMDNP
jgi:hypothetical protein